jgi:hypothetical protein
MSSIDDPILKELLTALKEDTQRMASDLLSVITTQALIAVFALFLAIASSNRAPSECEDLGLFLGCSRLLLPSFSLLSPSSRSITCCDYAKDTPDSML